MAQGMEAMRAGDGVKLVSVLQKAKDPVRMLNVLGGVADDNRWNAMHGRALLAAADYILAQPVGFGAVLLTSVGANAWMLLVPPDASRPTQPPSRSRPDASPRPTRHAPAEHPPASVAIPPDIAALERAALEHRLAEAEA